MRIAFDTNVVMDVLLVREPFVQDAAFLMEQVETGLLEAACSAAADAIVTRNPQDFSSASLSIYTPRELVQVLKS